MATGPFSNLNVDEAALREVFRNEALVGNVEEFCAPPQGLDEDALDSLPCSAGHTACYVSPYGDVYPCVQFPLPSGNVRRTKFVDIWRHSPQLNEVRSITLRDMPSCSQCAHGGTCTRCPGLAYLEGNMRGPSIQDCEKSFARTGIPSENLLVEKAAPNLRSTSQLIQIQCLPPAELVPVREAAQERRCKLLIPQQVAAGPCSISSGECLGLPELKKEAGKTARQLEISGAWFHRNQMPQAPPGDLPLGGAFLAI